MDRTEEVTDEILASDTPIDDEPIVWTPEKTSRAQIVATVVGAVAVAAITVMLIAYATWGFR